MLFFEIYIWWLVSVCVSQGWKGACTVVPSAGQECTSCSLTSGLKEIRADSQVGVLSVPDGVLNHIRIIIRLVPGRSLYYSRSDLIDHILRAR